MNIFKVLIKNTNWGSSWGNKNIKKKAADCTTKKYKKTVIKTFEDNFTHE
jgi:hypothetical protein